MFLRNPLSRPPHPLSTRQHGILVPAIPPSIATSRRVTRPCAACPRRFAATICGHIIRRQTELGIKGHIAEIGTFEGRFFIAMALGLAEGERALGIDTFNWPNDGLLDLFHCALRAARARARALHRDQGRTCAIVSADDIRKALGGQGPQRLKSVLASRRRSFARTADADLDLAAATLHPQGIICLDDMLHPGYPLLVVAVYEWLERHPDWRVLCVIDREDIVAAAKFVLCHKDVVPLFEQDLMDTFKAQHFVLGSEWERYFCVVLTPKPRLAEVD